MNLAQHINPVHPGNMREWQLRIESGSFSYQFPVTIRHLEYPQEELRHRLSFAGDAHLYYVPVHRTGGRLRVWTTRIRDLESVRELYFLSNRMSQANFEALAPDFTYTPPPPQTVILTAGSHKLTFDLCHLISYEINPASQLFFDTDYVAAFDWMYVNLTVEEDGREVSGFRMTVAREEVETNQFFRQEWLQELPEPPEQIVRNEFQARVGITPHRWRDPQETMTKKAIFPERYTNWQELGF